MDWYEKNARPLPWRATSDPYAIWVSEIMLQQTQVKTVIPFWERWMRELPDLKALAAAPEDRLLKLWEGLGYYRRVRNMQKAAQQIIQLHGGTFPSAEADILNLPGIGRYTAGAIGSIAFGQPVPILDGNVVRVLTRVYGILENPKTPETLNHLWKLATEWVMAARALGKNACSALNQGMMELGAVICLPRTPHCELCPLQNDCVANRKKWTDRIPALPERVQATRETRIAFAVMSADGKVLIRQRKETAVNGGLWEFPNAPLAETDDAAELFYRWSRTRPLCLERVLQIQHSITRYRITMNVYQVDVRDFKKIQLVNPNLIACSIGRLSEFAFPSAHRRIVQHLQRLTAESGRVTLSKK